MPDATALSPRMRRILDAAVRVTAGAGLRGLTHRAVDAEAGLPLGSTSAYLRTRTALLTATTGHVMDFFDADVAALTAELGGGADPELEITRTSAVFLSWLGEPDYLRARMELTVAASRQPELAQRLEGGRRRMVALVTPLVDGPDVPGHPVRAETVIAALDGVLLAALRMAPEERRAFVEQSLGLLVRAFNALD